MRNDKTGNERNELLKALSAGHEQLIVCTKSINNKITYEKQVHFHSIMNREVKIVKSKQSSFLYQPCKTDTQTLLK